LGAKYCTNMLSQTQANNANRLGRAAPWRSRMVVLAISSTVLLCALFSYLLLKPQSAEAVCSQTIQALERRDSAALIALAEPEELKKLNLTQSTVDSILSQTVWTREYSGPHTFTEEEGTRRVDTAFFLVKDSTAGPLPALPPIVINALGTRDTGWKLNLSSLLYSTCWRRANGDRSAALDLWNSFRDRYQILGSRLKDGSYKSYTPRMVSSPESVQP
jgi:hypothetical protein